MKTKEIYLPFFQEENTYFKIDENDGFKIIIKQRFNEQIICGSSKSKNGSEGQIEFFEENPKVLLK